MDLWYVELHAEAAVAFNMNLLAVCRLVTSYIYQLAKILFVLIHSLKMTD